MIFKKNGFLEQQNALIILTYDAQMVNKLNGT